MKRCALVLIVALLAGCVPLMLAVNLLEIGVFVGTDPRPVTVMTRDFELGGRLNKAIGAEFAERAHVSVNVFDGVVLLSGEVPDAGAQQRLAALAAAESDVRRLHDRTVIAPPASPSERANDTRLTALVKAKVIAYASDSLESMHVMVVTDRRVVYLLGRTRAAYAEQAAIAARLVNGVAHVEVLIDTGAVTGMPVSIQPTEASEPVEPPDGPPPAPTGSQ